MRLHDGDSVASVSLIPHLTKELEDGMNEVKSEVAELMEEIGAMVG
jgi:hypothetical protein